MQRKQKLSPPPGEPSPAEGRVRADNPISRPEEDALGRRESARQFAVSILSVDASRGAVVGLYGPWGSGKTSFLELARPHLAVGAAHVIDFNPWLFSGTEQLAGFFFSDLAGQLKLRKDLRQIAGTLADYGQAVSGLDWVPLVGPWTARARSVARLSAKLLKSGDRSLRSQRDRVVRAIAKLSKPVVVIVDDVDRLSLTEIREIFRLVRLTASFPNLVYLLAFDRRPVEAALTDAGVLGADYLEKIVQLTYNLPEISKAALLHMAATELTAACSDVDVGDLDESRYPDVFAEIVLPLLRGPRDVRRYAAAVASTARSMGKEMDLVDLLGVEAVRIFLPQMFGRLYPAVEALTQTGGSSWRSEQRDQCNKKTVDGLIATAGEHGAVARAAIERLFPAAQRHLGNTHYGDEWERQWLLGRRVACKDILELYLERVKGPGLMDHSDAQRAWGIVTSSGDLGGFLRSLNRNRLEGVIRALELFEEDYRPEHAVAASVALLNLLPLPERRLQMFEMDSSFAVTRVVLRLLRKITNPSEAETAIRAILPRLSSLYAKHELLRLAGHADGAGHKLLSEAAAADLNRSWRDELRGAAPQSLAMEQDLASLLSFARSEASAGEAPIDIPDAPEVTLAVLRSARNEVKSQGLGSRAVKRSARLHWEGVVGIYGGEGVLHQRIETLRAAQLADSGEILALADRYIAGWRPGRFTDD